MDNVVLFNKILDLLDDKKRKPQINKMLDSIFERFKKAPASTKTDFHNCYEGGLLDHSNIVTLKMLSDLDNYKSPLNSVILTGLFHDLGKVGNKTMNFYVPAENWKMTRGTIYEIPQDMKILPHASRSIHILNQFDIPLTEHEFQAILYHNLLPEERGAIKYAETPLLILLHQADAWACFVYEKSYKQDSDILNKLLKKLR